MFQDLSHLATQCSMCPASCEITSTADQLAVRQPCFKSSICSRTLPNTAVAILRPIQCLNGGSINDSIMISQSVYTAWVICVLRRRTKNQPFGLIHSRAELLSFSHLLVVLVVSIESRGILSCLYSDLPFIQILFLKFSEIQVT